MFPDRSALGKVWAGRPRNHSKEEIKHGAGRCSYARIEGRWSSPRFSSHWLISLGSGLLSWEGDGPSNTGLYALEGSSGEYKR